MRGKQKFEVEHTPTFGSITVEIDFTNTKMSDMIKEMVEFWSGWKERLKDNSNDYIKTFLKQLCERSLSIAFEKDYNIDGVISEFDSEEGYYKMDGSDGILLVSMSQIEIGEQDDYEITNIPYKSISNN